MYVCMQIVCGWFASEEKAAVRGRCVRVCVQVGMVGSNRVGERDGRERTEHGPIVGGLRL